MRDVIEKPDPARVLRTLKAFQRDTVDYVFQRMYEDAIPARRFLVADEVGLGKTLVARGVIARAIEHLWDKVGRIDIVYICSNSGIARQNISRLNVTGHSDHRLPDRITLLPRDVRNLRHRKLNFVSFTPGTSFNLRSSMGVAEERALLFWLLPSSWTNGSAEPGAISLLCGAAERSRFQTRVSEFTRFYSIDEELQSSFREVLASAGGLEQRFRELTGELGKRNDFSDEQNKRRAAVIGDLRQLLARVCINALEPDLIILDEFQRFKDLLHGDDFAAELARALFAYESSDGSIYSRVLLLSATPYKMYTLDEEADAGEHHLRDFLDTVRFLHGDESRTEAFRQVLDEYSRELWRSRSGAGTQLRGIRERMQGMLSRVMVRTERLAVTPDRNGMLTEVPPRTLSLQSADLQSYVAMQRVAAVVRHGDTLEYWKSAPYVLNFMEDYQLKEHFRQAAVSGIPALYDALGSLHPVLLAKSDVEAYARLDPANARLRWLLDATIEQGAAERFWLPPSRPYYVLDGRFGEAGAATKHLVFSAWQVVPKVVASLVSYEAERRLLRVPDAGEPGANTAVARKRRTGRLRFTRSKGRLSGMPVLSLVYPSTTLAVLGDPLAATAALVAADGSLPTLDDVIHWVTGRIAEALEDVVPRTASAGPADQKWYWAAPILLDLAKSEEATRTWFGQANLSKLWEVAAAVDEAAATEPVLAADDIDRWSEHVDEARTLLKRGEAIALGAVPDDLSSVLALLAVGGLANNALRAVSRVTGEAGRQHVAVRNAAGQIANGLRSLFNQPEVTASLQRSEDDGSYWRQVLEYAARGCLSAVLDEYAHVGVEADSLAGKSVEEIAGGLAARMTSALTLQTATLRADDVTLDPQARSVKLKEPLGFRTAFAVRYGARGDEGVAADRNQKLQTAFNSPFWPFVLCTTSVGQEGLDFHWYCHAVVHWNLPSNPVDLEQREGRVHRYKGHAVRKNVAAKHQDAAFRAGDIADPWGRMFKEARSNADDDDDIVPYWVYTVDGGAQIQRHVPVLPLSKDTARKNALKRALAVYRMAFGQSRQEDLVAFLAANISESDRQKMAADVMIDLSPPRSDRRRESGIDATTEPVTGARSGVESPLIGLLAPLGLDALHLLLDEFVRARARPKHPLASAVPTAAEPLRYLLDRFAESRARVAGDPTAAQSRGDRVIAREQLLGLLDAYTTIRPVILERSDMLPRYRELLDMFAIVERT